jgi:hypothetical protein
LKRDRSLSGNKHIGILGMTFVEAESAGNSVGFSWKIPF